MPNQRVIVEAKGTDPTSFMFEGLDMESSPTFAIGEVTKMLFAMGPGWMRWLDKQGVLVFDGVPTYTRTRASARSFNLAEMEKTCHALMEHQSIDGHKFIAALNVVRDIGIVHGFLVLES